MFRTISFSSNEKFMSYKYAETIFSLHDNVSAEKFSSPLTFYSHMHYKIAVTLTFFADGCRPFASVSLFRNNVRIRSGY